MTSGNSNIQRLQGCTYLGGVGFPFASGEIIEALFEPSEISIRGAKRSARFSYVELAELSISGPGKVTTGGGFVGGGFGVEGAIEGIAVATILNALSSRTKINTFITVITNFGEAHLHYASMEPGALRIGLAPVFLRIRQSSPEWMSSRIAAIEAEHAAGNLTTENLADLKSRLRNPPAWPDPDIEATLRRQEEDARASIDFESAPKGMCPNCDRVISQYSQTCPHCQSIFGVGSAWQIKPLLI